MTAASDKEKNLSYQVNEKVLCYHGPLIYEAKVSILVFAFFEKKKKYSFASPRFWSVVGWKKILNLQVLIIMCTTKAGKEGLLYNYPLQYHFY